MSGIALNLVSKAAISALPTSLCRNVLPNFMPLRSKEKSPPDDSLLRAASCDAPTLPDISPTCCIFFVVAYNSSTSLASALIASCCFLLNIQIPATTAPIARGSPTSGFINTGSNIRIPCKPNINGIIFCAISPTLPPANDAAMVSPLSAPTPTFAFAPKALIFSFDNLFCFALSFVSVVAAFVAAVSSCVAAIFSFNAFSCKRVCFNMS